MCAPRVTRHTSIRYSSSCHTCVNMSASIFFAAAMIRGFRSTRSHGNGGTNTFAYFARNARCTVSTDLLVWYSNTQNDFSPGAAIFSLHTLASPSGRNVNYDKKKQLTGGKNWVVPSICTGFVNTYPTVFLQYFLQSWSTLWNALYWDFIVFSILKNFQFIV